MISLFKWTYEYENDNVCQACRDKTCLSNSQLCVDCYQKFSGWNEKERMGFSTPNVWVFNNFIKNDPKRLQNLIQGE